MKYDSVEEMFAAIRQHINSHEAGPAAIEMHDDIMERTVGFACVMCREQFNVSLVDLKRYKNNIFFSAVADRQRIADHLSADDFDIVKLFSKT